MRIKMYKNYKIQAKNLSSGTKSNFSLLAEKLVPFLILAAAFAFLWK
jgi:hypothetical protein